jgi:hypothetical protein
MLRFAAKPCGSLCRFTGKKSISHGEISPSFHAAAGLSLLRNGTPIRDFHSHNNSPNQRWTLSAFLKSEKGDFCSELIPSFTTFPSNISSRAGPIRIVGVRHFSDSKKDNPETSRKEESSATPSEHSSPNTLESASVDKATETSGENAEGGIRGIVNSVRPRLKKVSSDINPGDLISVIGIVALIAIIVVAPTLIR